MGTDDDAAADDEGHAHSAFVMDGRFRSIFSSAAELDLQPPAPIYWFSVHVRPISALSPFSG